MSTKQAIRFTPETLRSLGFASIVAGYTAIGTALANPARIFYLQNLTDGALTFSFDGTNDHLVLDTASYLLIDVTANKSFSSGFYIAQGDTIYVKRLDTPTTGSVYLSVFYGEDGY